MGLKKLFLLVPVILGSIISTYGMEKSKSSSENIDKQYYFQQILKISKENNIDLYNYITKYKPVPARPDGIMYYITSDNIDAIQSLIDQKIDLNVGSIFQNPLINAVAYDRVAIVKLLLENGVKINSNIPKYNNLLFTSVKSPAMLKLLIDHGFDVKKTIGQGTNLLCFLITYMQKVNLTNKLAMIELLIDNGANVNGDILSEGIVENSPLFAAIQTQKIEIVKSLLELGGDVNLKENGKSPLEVAEDLKDEDIIKFLRDHEAKK